MYLRVFVLVMPLSLTNASDPFQALMNHIFEAYLRVFVLTSFGDILVYSPFMEQHKQHFVFT